MKLKKWVTIKFSLCLRAFAVKNTFRKIKSVVHFLPVIVFLVIGSCNNPSTQKNVIPLEPTQKEKLELGKVSKIIKLETSPESSLGFITKTITDYENNRIFLLSEFNVYIFSSDGNFISSLKKGKGPGEINMIIAISANREKQLFCVLDGSTRICIFDYNGKFVDESRLEGIYANDIQWIDSENVFLQNLRVTEKEPWFVFGYDLSKKSIKKRFISMEGSSYPEFFIITGDNFHFSGSRKLFTTTNIFGIYEFNTDDFRKIITFDLGRRAVPESFIEKTRQNNRRIYFDDDALNAGYIPYLLNSFYFREYILAVLYDDIKSCYAISEKNREKVYLNGPISTYFGLPALESFKNPTEINENYLVFAVNPTDFFVENPTSDKTTVEIGNQKLEVELEENPFLVVVE